MSIEKKLNEMGIKEIMVIDDSPENLEAAKKYLDTMDLNVCYLSNESQAIERLQKLQESKEKFDLVITDLEMETKKSGIGVVKKALETGTYTVILTGRNYHLPDTDPHGPNTNILPLNESIKGKKDKPGTWERALEEIVKYFSSPETQRIYNSVRRYQKHVGKTPELFIDEMIKEYG